MTRSEPFISEPRSVVLADLEEELRSEIAVASGSQIPQLLDKYLPLIRQAAVTEADEWPMRWFLWTACPHEEKSDDTDEMLCGDQDFKRAPIWALQSHVKLALDDHNGPGPNALRETIAEIRVQLAAARNTSVSLRRELDKRKR